MLVLLRGGGVHTRLYLGEINVFFFLRLILGRLWLCKWLHLKDYNGLFKTYFFWSPRLNHQSHTTTAFNSTALEKTTHMGPANTLGSRELPQIAAKTT